MNLHHKTSSRLKEALNFPLPLVLVGAQRGIPLTSKSPKCLQLVQPTTIPIAETQEQYRNLDICR